MLIVVMNLPLHLLVNAGGQASKQSPESQEPLTNNAGGQASTPLQELEEPLTKKLLKEKPNKE